eukprot:15472884-Alexandrium_andersonii.AAC.1
MGLLTGHGALRALPKQTLHIKDSPPRPSREKLWFPKVPKPNLWGKRNNAPCAPTVGPRWSWGRGPHPGLPELEAGGARSKCGQVWAGEGLRTRRTK